MVTDNDLKYLNRCVELATKALEAGDSPFGSVLVSKDGKILFEDHNHIITTGDSTQHPEFNIARWSAENLSAEERAVSTVYTSGEHCPMCSAAHGLVGLGRIVYVSSAEQLGNWRSEMGAQTSPIQMLPIQKIAPGVQVDGPVPELAEKIHELHKKFHNRK